MRPTIPSNILIIRIDNLGVFTPQGRMTVHSSRSSICQISSRHDPYFSTTNTAEDLRKRLEPTPRHCVLISKKEKHKEERIGGWKEKTHLGSSKGSALGSA